MYGCLALENNSEVGDAVPVRFSLSPTCEVEGRRFNFQKDQMQKGPEMVLGYLLMVSRPNLGALEQSGLHESQQCVASQVCLCS